jgi:hypothetical protein
MNIFARIFNYPSKNLVMSFFALLGLSVSLLMDSGDIENSFLMQALLFLPVVMASFVAEDILTIFTKAQHTQTRSMIHLKMSKLQKNIILGIVLFIVLTYFRYNFYDYYYSTSYKHGIMFTFMAFQFASLLISLRAWNEKKRRLEPSQSN